MADRVIAPLREARQPLHLGLAKLQLAASAVERADAQIALSALEEAASYLRDLVLPTCRAEEFTVFIAVDGVLGATGTCEVLKAQHTSIGKVAEDFARVVEAARTDNDPVAYARYLLPLLHGAYALIRAHIESEDDVFLPLLDAHLSESQVGVIVDNLARIVNAVAGNEAPVEL